MDDFHVELIALFLIAIGLFLSFFILRELPIDGFLVEQDSFVYLDVEVLTSRSYSNGFVSTANACRELTLFSQEQISGSVRVIGELSDGSVFVDSIEP